MWESFSIKDTMTCFAVLFAVIDIVGSIPIIVSLKQKTGHIAAEKTTLISAGIIVVFLFLGEKLLDLVSVDINSFAIAGAFVIFIIALEMVLGREINKPSELDSSTIVPLAFPLIAGAGTLTTTLSLKAGFATVNILGGVFLNAIVIYAVLKSAGYIERKLGAAAIQVLQKIFGIILLAISIRLFTINFAALIQQSIQF